MSTFKKIQPKQSDCQTQTLPKLYAPFQFCILLKEMCPVECIRVLLNPPLNFSRVFFKISEVNVVIESAGTGGVLYGGSTAKIQQLLSRVFTCQHSHNQGFS